MVTPPNRGLNPHSISPTLKQGNPLIAKLYYIIFTETISFANTKIP